MLETKEMGDRNPSQFLRQLQDLTDSTLIRSDWLKRLALEVRTILVTQKNGPLSKQAELANSIVATIPISHVSDMQSGSSLKALISLNFWRTAVYSIPSEKVLSGTSVDYQRLANYPDKTRSDRREMAIKHTTKHIHTDMFQRKHNNDVVEYAFESQYILKPILKIYYHIRLIFYRKLYLQLPKEEGTQVVAYKAKYSRVCLKMMFLYIAIISL